MAEWVPLIGSTLYILAHISGRNRHCLNDPQGVPCSVSPDPHLCASFFHGCQSLSFDCSKPYTWISLLIWDLWVSLLNNLIWEWYWGSPNLQLVSEMMFVLGTPKFATRLTSDWLLQIHRLCFKVLFCFLLRTVCEKPKEFPKPF